MPKYVFSQGKVRVEDGVYLPLLHQDKSSESGVLILPTPDQDDEIEQPTEKQENQDDKE